MIRILTPIEAGQYDPPMQEWLALPVGLGDGSICPECGSTHFGTANPIGYFPVRDCHDERGIGCHERYRGPVTSRMIYDVVGALTGVPRRLG